MHYPPIYGAVASKIYPSRAFVSQPDAVQFDLAEAQSLLRISKIPDRDSPEWRALVFFGEYLKSLPQELDPSTTAAEV